MHVHTTHTHTCTHIYTYVHTYTDVHKDAHHIYAHIYIHTYTQTYTHIHASTCTHIYTNNKMLKCQTSLPMLLHKVNEYHLELSVDLKQVENRAFESRAVMVFLITSAY